MNLTMENDHLFTQEALNEIFKISPNDPDRVISRESGSLEFKEAFGWNSLAKYLKTSGAYANTRGGYIVFGISNNPHRLVGLSGNRLKTFQDIDPEKMSQHFNEHFAPEIKWEILEYVLEDRTFGLLYIHEAFDKPVVCTKNAGQELKEGDIYYRYRGRTERVKYPELRQILDVKRANEQKLWMKHLECIARIGVREAAVFDLHTGHVSGAGGTFVIEESMLSQLSFIREGEFSEVKGQPTLKLVGEVQSLSGPVPGNTSGRIVKTKGIRIGDIVLNFLDKVSVPDPEEYLKQVCFESSAYLPVHFYIRKAKMSTPDAITFLEGVVSRSPTRVRLIERLQEKKTQSLPIPEANTDSAIRRKRFAKELRQKAVDEGLSGPDLLSCLQALRALTSQEIRARSSYLRGLLKLWFNKHYATADGVLADNLRRSICWLDEARYMEDEK